MTNPVLEAVRRSLALARASEENVAPGGGGLPGVSGIPMPPIPIPPSRPAGSLDAEITLFLEELHKLSAAGQRLSPPDLPAALQELVRTHSVRKAALWSTPRLDALGIAECLRHLGVEVLPHGADKHALAGCDLGVTEADYALAETGTIGLLASPEKPRAVSLLPGIHLAILHSSAFRPDLQQVFAECKGSPYLVLITGPSRTADIELIVTLGVHGPRYLVVWVVD